MEWIFTNGDLMPKGLVILATFDGRVSVGFYCYDTKDFFFYDNRAVGGGYKTNNVRCWMPFPKPPDYKIK